MSTTVLTNAHVSIDGNDLSDHVKQVTLPYGCDEVDDTHMGDDTHQMIAGLKTWSVDIEFSQDFAASNLDSILFPLVGAAAVTVIVRPTASAVSATNPNYTGSAILSSYPPFGGTVGDKATTNVHMASAGTLSRATS